MYHIYLSLYTKEKDPNKIDWPLAGGDKGGSGRGAWRPLGRASQPGMIRDRLEDARSAGVFLIVPRLSFTEKRPLAHNILTENNDRRYAEL